MLKPPPDAVLDGEVESQAETVAQPQAPVGPVHPIPGIMQARRPHLLMGSPSSGKTRIAARLVQQVLSGGSVLAWETPDHRPIPWGAYLAGSKPGSHVQGAFEAVGIPNLPIYELEEGWHHKPSHTPSATDPFPKFTHALAQLRKSHGTLPEDALLVVDEIALFFDFNPSGYYNNTAATMKKITSMCKELRVTLLLIHVTCKGSKDKSKGRINQLETINGSAAILRYCDLKLLLLEPEESSEPHLGFHELLATPRNAPKARMLLQIEPGGTFTHVGADVVEAQRQALADAEEEKLLAEVPKITALGQLILSKLTQEWYLRATLRKELAQPPATFSRHVERLVKNKLVEESVDKRYIRLISDPKPEEMN